MFLSTTCTATFMKYRVMSLRLHTITYACNLMRFTTCHVTTSGDGIGAGMESMQQAPSAPSTAEPPAAMTATGSLDTAGSDSACGGGGSGGSAAAHVCYECGATADTLQELQVCALTATSCSHRRWPTQSSRHGQSPCVLTLTDTLFATVGDATRAAACAKLGAAASCNVHAMFMHVQSCPQHSA